MAPGRKTDKFKGWLSGFFPHKEEIYHTPDGPQCQGESFTNIKNIVANNSVHIRGDNNTVGRLDGQRDRSIETQIMNLLSQHIIRGAAHDSSARTPPPRCHPNTRLKLIARITAWFESPASLELLLWITGPAGVGKSAVVQTFAEYLAKSKILGASVFLSRPNKRNNPHCVFITIAYQLAARIEAYRDFIVERLRLDPELLSGDMRTQFLTFIVEPFVEKKIGGSGRRWGILLDGLDELQGEDAQCEIIQLISTFTLEHRDAPLIWIIASRPESHISNTFDDDEVRPSRWLEYIPIDSTEACADVERFLRSSFMATQKKFRHSVPSDWPGNSEFLKLTAAASGLFVYAEVVMQFIRDSDHADPVSRFELLLSVIDRSNAVPTKENPFVHLDALYSEILSSIPSTLWPTAKRLLGFTIHEEHLHAMLPHTLQNLQNLRGMPILFGVTRYVIYACLNKCRSTLKIPDWQIAHKEKLMFHHASFADYLKDSRRAGDFYVGNKEDVGEDSVLSLFEVWNKCGGDDLAASSVESAWRQYCSKLDDKSPSRVVAEFYANCFLDVVGYLRRTVYRISDIPVESSAYAQLRRVYMRNLCSVLDVGDSGIFIWSLMDVSSNFHDTGFLREVRLGDLAFGHLGWKEMSPVYAHYGKSGKFSNEQHWKYHRPRSSAQLNAFVSELESLQETSPELKVVIFGGIPKGRVAVFYYPLEMEFDYAKFYMIPYPE